MIGEDEGKEAPHVHPLHSLHPSTVGDDRREAHDTDGWTGMMVVDIIREMNSRKPIIYVHTPPPSSTSFHPLLPLVTLASERRRERQRECGRESREGR